MTNKFPKLDSDKVWGEASSILSKDENHQIAMRQKGGGGSAIELKVCNGRFSSFQSYLSAEEAAMRKELVGAQSLKAMEKDF